MPVTRKQILERLKEIDLEIKETEIMLAISEDEDYNEGMREYVNLLTSDKQKIKQQLMVIKNDNSDND